MKADYNQLRRFVNESNAIEGIVRPATSKEIDVLGDLLELDELRVADVENFVRVVASAALRVRPGMDVYVGAHRPIPGGPQVEVRLHILLAQISHLVDYTPYEAHCLYETLHPFIDGNGRSGRAIWAWHMRKDGSDPFRLGFLHQWYYQSLEASR